MIWEELQHLEATYTGIVQGTTTRPIVAGKDKDKFDGQDREVVMLIKLSVIDEMLPEVQAGKT